MLGLGGKGDTALMAPIVTSSRHDGRAMNIALIHARDPVLLGHTFSPANSTLFDPS